MLKVFHKKNSYTDFSSISVSRTLDSICGTFVLSTTLNNNMPFGKGSFITITADDIIVMSGFIEKVKGSITNNGATVSFSGRDFLGDMIDSSLPEDVAVTEGTITLPALCTKVIKSLGIKSKVKDLAGDIAPFAAEEVKTTEYGGKAASFLQSYARKRSVFLTSFGNGFLVLFRPPTNVPYREKLTKDSMLSREFEYSDISRYNKITVGSESNMVDSLLGDIVEDDVDKKASATDSGVRETRILNITADETMKADELGFRAQEEINLRRGKAFKFTCTVPSHRYVIGTLVNVHDDLSGISGVFLIKQVDYSQTDKGLLSTLTLCFPDTYGGKAKRRSKNTAVVTDPAGNTPDEAPLDWREFVFKGTYYYDLFLKDR